MSEFDPSAYRPKGEREDSIVVDNDDGARRRLLLIAGGALVALVVLGAALWLAYNRGVEAGADLAVPVIAAPEGTAKLEPEDPGGMDIPHQDKAVFDKMAGGQEPEVEQLLPGPEEPVDKPTIARGVGDAGETKPKILKIPQSSGPVDAETGEDTAPSESEMPAPESLPETDVAAAPVKSPVAAGDAPDESATATETTGVAAGSAPPPGNFLVQLGSFRSRDAAVNGWDIVSKRHPGLVTDLKPFIDRADLGERGIYYRLQAGLFGTRTAAQNACDRLKSAGQDCLVTAS